MNDWITRNWFPMLICASLAIAGEPWIALTMFLVWELYRFKNENDGR